MVVIKKTLIVIRSIMKYCILFAISIFIIIGIIGYIYHPTYAVIVDGEEIGYIQNKTEFQKKINDYMMGDEANNIGYIQIENLPEYKLCLLHKNEKVDQDNLYNKIISTGVPYYKYCSIVVDGEEKAYTSTKEEAESIIETLKNKKSENVDQISIINKYCDVKPEFKDKDTIINNLYKETKVVQSVKIAKESTNRKKYSADSNARVSKSGGYINPVSKYKSIGAYTATHHGIDICASEGTPIYAVASGTVSFSGYGQYGHGYGGYGNVVVINHGNNTQTLYGHCYSLVVKKGQSVSQGQLIGFVGNTGMSYGNHCHFEVRVGGNKVNPRNYVY